MVVNRYSDINIIHIAQENYNKVTRFNTLRYNVMNNFLITMFYCYLEPKLAVLLGVAGERSAQLDIKLTIF